MIGQPRCGAGSTAVARGAEKSHAPRARGRIASLFPLAGYGFIETPDGREIYFHRHAISDPDFKAADVGSAVFFSEEEGERGPQAAAVQLIHPHARGRHGHGNGEAES